MSTRKAPVAGVVETPAHVHGRLLADIHIAGYTFQRALDELRWLLEGDRWKALGFADGTAFVESIYGLFSPFKATVEQRKEVAKALSGLASQRAIAKVLDVDHKTVAAAVGKTPQPAAARAKENKDAAPGAGESSPPAAFQRAVDPYAGAKQQEKQERRADRRLAALEERQREQGVGAVTITHCDALTFLTVLEPASVDLLLTDPPYSTDLDDVEHFCAEWLPPALACLRPTGRAYIFTGAYTDEQIAYMVELRRLSKPSGWTLDHTLVWTYRNTIGPSSAHRYKLNWQACFHLFGPDAPPLNAPELVEQFTVQDVNAPDARTGVRLHTWQKPDELAERLIRHSTQPGQLVLDPFCGTGTFLAAASRLGRNGIGCDVDPAMLALCRQRGLDVELGGVVGPSRSAALTRAPWREQGQQS